MKRVLVLLAWAGAFWGAAAAVVTLGIVTYCRWRWGGAFAVDVVGLRGLQWMFVFMGDSVSERDIESLMTRVSVFAAAIPVLSLVAGLLLGLLGLLPGTKLEQKGGGGVA